MTNTKISKLLKKYQIYISDLKWHIKTNIFDFEYIRNCRFRIKCYEEIVRELKAIEQYDSQQQDSREPNKAIKVKIIKGNGWYQNAVGKEFEVIKYGRSYVFLLDYQRGYGVEWRHIDFEDCDVIQPKPKEQEELWNEVITIIGTGMYRSDSKMREQLEAYQIIKK